MAEADEVVWDDSILVDSWTDALNEYKKYHSIRARGGNIRDLENESTPNADNASRPNAAGGDHLPFVENGIHQGSAQIPAPAVLGSVEDGNLKRLLMAWYYAGYYMGLYEGHQQAQQSPL
ncbi:hypothetical protein CP532_1758 [Ophiocordyceps camponoti-leonardi (nom. inval.)]|nr:hypothetical protein CP532_1758 [Ophiocordyceps camponoti-leonardi (nom. inval.)]